MRTKAPSTEHRLARAADAGKHKRCGMCHKLVVPFIDPFEPQHDKGWCPQCENSDPGWVDPVVHRGHSYRRTRWQGDPLGNREKILADMWERENDPVAMRGTNGGWGILSALLREHPTQRDAFVAATIIQWLGTNVGFCFLVKMIEAMGYGRVSGRRSKP